MNIYHPTQFVSEIKTRIVSVRVSFSYSPRHSDPGWTSTLTSSLVCLFQKVIQWFSWQQTIFLLYCNLFPSTKEMADVLLCQMCQVFGFPSNVISDHNLQFVTKFWRTCHRQHTRNLTLVILSCTHEGKTRHIYINILYVYIHIDIQKRNVLQQSSNVQVCKCS